MNSAKGVEEAPALCFVRHLSIRFANDAFLLSWRGAGPGGERKGGWDWGEAGVKRNRWGKERKWDVEDERKEEAGVGKGRGTRSGSGGCEKRQGWGASWAESKRSWGSRVQETACVGRSRKHLPGCRWSPCLM